jgi:hypothetical protein
MRSMTFLLLHQASTLAALFTALYSALPKTSELEINVPKVINAGHDVPTTRQRVFYCLRIFHLAFAPDS